MAPAQKLGHKVRHGGAKGGRKRGRKGERKGDSLGVPKRGKFEYSNVCVENMSLNWARSIWMKYIKWVVVINNNTLDEAYAPNKFIHIYWLCFAASFLATASAFLKASHSSLGIWPGAFGQYRLPRNCVCPVPTIAWLHTLQLYSFRGCFAEQVDSSFAVCSCSLFRCRQSVVRLTGFDWDEHVWVGCTARLPTFAWPTVSALSGISSGVVCSAGAVVGRSLWAGSASFAIGYCTGNDFPWMRVFISSRRVLFLYLSWYVVS